MDDALKPADAPGPSRSGSRRFAAWAPLDWAGSSSWQAAPPPMAFAIMALAVMGIFLAYFATRTPSDANVARYRPGLNLPFENDATF